MAYATTYDGGLIHSMSRRPSVSYGIPAPTTYRGYTEPGLRASIIYPYSAIIGIRLITILNTQYPPSPYAMHAPESGVAVVPHSRRLTGPCKFQVRFRPAFESNDFFQQVTTTSTAIQTRLTMMMMASMEDIHILDRSLPTF